MSNNRRPIMNLVVVDKRSGGNAVYRNIGLVWPNNFGQEDFDSIEMGQLELYTPEDRPITRGVQLGISGSRDPQYDCTVDEALELLRLASTEKGVFINVQSTFKPRDPEGSAMGS